MNCTASPCLAPCFRELLEEFRNRTQTSSADKEKNAHLFIIVIVVFYAAIAMALLLAYIKSRKLENKNDPYHIYIKKNWNVAEGARALESDRDSVEIEQLLN
ncbi:potassium voltage-gated channel subfamily E member 2-like [Erpetoichthys calabaricus]|uniref:potassium voltage-gated channel subfamily E member 2-like n=1 Tax=Erpetoichthys calabaricus TaxID=27687 RepID=UPI0010A0B83C|nr:potassium voltage-gated channel subfamily E member 2-like [Erpetoichthys calabaricus]